MNVQVKSRNLFRNPDWGTWHIISTKEHLTNFAMIRHGNKQKMQMHTTKINQQQQLKSHAFPKKTTTTKSKKEREREREKGISLKIIMIK